MTPISRHDAQFQGLKHYFTGVPCHRGHVAQRYVSTKSCILCLAESTKMARTKPKPVNRPGVVCLKGLHVPQKHVRAIVEMAAAFCAMEGLLPGPPPGVTTRGPTDAS